MLEMTAMSEGTIRRVDYDPFFFFDNDIHEHYNQRLLSLIYSSSLIYPLLAHTKENNRAFTIILL